MSRARVQWFPVAVGFRATQSVAITSLGVLATHAFRVSPAQVGGLSAGVAITSIVGSMALGSVMSRTNALTGVCIASSLLSIAMALLATASSMGVLILGIVLLGSAGGVLFPSLATVVGVTPTSDSDRAFALYGVALSVGLTVGPIAEALLLLVAGGRLRIVYGAFTLIPILSCVLALGHRSSYTGFPASVRSLGQVVIHLGCGRRRLPEQVRRVTSAGAGLWRYGTYNSEGTRFAWTALVVRGSADRELRAWAQVLKSQQWLVACLLEVFYNIPFAGITTFGLLVGRSDYGMSVFSAEIGFVAFFGVSFGARLWLVRTNATGHKWPLVWGSVGLTLVGVLVLGAAHTLWLYYVALITLGIPHGVTYPLVMGQIARGLPSSVVVRGNAMVSVAANLVAVTVPVAVGLVVPLVGYGSTLLMMSVPLVVVASALWCMRRVVWVA